MQPIAQTNRFVRIGGEGVSPRLELEQQEERTR